MLNFEPCTLELLRSLTPTIRGLPTICTDLSAGTIWMWRAEQEPKICIRNNTLVLRQTMNGYPAFTYPVGEDVDGMLDALAEQAKAENIALRFFAMDKRALRRLLADPRFPRTMWGYDRRWSDYVYQLKPFATLNGEGMSQFRFDVRHFLRQYGEPEARPLLPEHLPQAREMLENYVAEHTDKGMLETAELIHSWELLNACWKLDLPALGLWVQGKLVAFSIGEAVGKTLMVHVSKALSVYRGIYRVLFWSFANYAQDLYGGKLRLINWEDDSGDFGLREAKERLHPICLFHKYQAHVRAPGWGVQEYPILRAENVMLTPFREEDKAAYLRMNLDRENNRWWGYDYTQDYTVPKNPDIETFYTSVQFDMGIGDSMNFAVREQEDGPMEGEMLLWNFTDNGEGEIGYRLLPEYQGKRLSTPAVVVLARYAEEELGLTTKIRCCHSPDNVRGIRTARSAGFVEVGRDSSWIHFRRKGPQETGKKDVL